MTLFRRKKTFNVSEPDPEYNVVYLGNVLTVLAKGEGCIDKPLSLIWQTYCAEVRPDLAMKLSVTKSGLKAVTKQQGLTEYWAHRITYCVASADYPRVFAWVYKHEGKRMKPELRCHAVLCKTVEKAQAIAVLLADKLSSALKDYRREKISRQNVRLSGTLVGYPSIPIRKQLLSTGAQNFRPPLDRCKSAPRLHSIDEDVEDEDEEEMEQVHHLLATRLSVDVDSFFKEEESFVVPGTPKEDEFKRRNADFRVDLEIGNDINKLRDDDRILLYLQQSDSLSSNVDAEGDSISDESGYNDEKSSLEDEETNDMVFEDDIIQVTSL